MFRTTVALMLTLLAAIPAAAAGHETGSVEPESQAAVGASPFVAAAMSAKKTSITSAESVAVDIDWSRPPVKAGLRRGAALPMLYVSLTGLNAYDAYSTTSGISKGASESNPLMRGAARNPAAIWAIKAGVTAGTITMAERLWRSDKRVQAVTVMIISNGMMAAVAARNASVLRTR